MNIRVDLNTPINDGTEVVFRSPVDCSQITGLIVYYNGESKEFAFADAHGNDVGHIDHLFAENVAVKVILDVTTSMAFVQNADTNAYLEGRFTGIEAMVDKLCPTFTESGSVVTCQPVEGYPLTVTAEEGASQITRCGKNLFDISKIKATTIPESQYSSTGEIAEVGADYIAVKTYEGYTGNGFTHTNVKFREVCPSVRVGDTITLNAITDAAQRIFYLTPAQIPIYFGKAIEVTEAMLDSNLIIYGFDNLKNNQGVGVCIVKNIQVEFGNAATAYELYKEAETFPIGEQIPALPGGNSLFADSGVITVSGKADIAAKLERLENAILTMGANV